MPFYFGLDPLCVSIYTCLLTKYLKSVPDQGRRAGASQMNLSVCLSYVMVLPQQKPRVCPDAKYEGDTDNHRRVFSLAQTHWTDGSTCCLPTGARMPGNMGTGLLTPCGHSDARGRGDALWPWLSCLGAEDRPVQPGLPGTELTKTTQLVVKTGADCAQLPSQAETRPGGAQGRRDLVLVSDAPGGNTKLAGRPAGSLSGPRCALLTLRLVPGPPMGKPRELSSSMTPKI